MKKNEILHQGTLLIKKTGRDELFWVAVIFSCYFFWQIAYRLLQNSQTASYATTAFLAVAVIAKFTFLRSWSIDHLDWSMDKKNLYLAGNEIPLRDIEEVRFQRNKLTGGSWYLNAKGVYRIHLESLSSPAAMRAESIETMKELAFALDPSLKSKPHLLPDR